MINENGLGRWCIKLSLLHILYFNYTMQSMDHQAGKLFYSLQFTFVWCKGFSNETVRCLLHLKISQTHVLHCVRKNIIVAIVISNGSILNGIFYFPRACISSNINDIMWG